MVGKLTNLYFLEENNNIVLTLTMGNSFKFFKGCFQIILRSIDLDLPSFWLLNATNVITEYHKF